MSRHPYRVVSPIVRFQSLFSRCKGAELISVTHMLLDIAFCNKHTEGSLLIFKAILAKIDAVWPADCSP